MPLPTMSLRAAPEHHQLIRDIGTALRARPELAGVLRDVLRPQHGTVERDTDALQSILDRLDALESAFAARAERELLPIEQVRQVTAMQKAGKSDVEIKAWLDQRRAHPDGEPAAAVT